MCYLKTIEGPASKFEPACLFIKRKVSDVYITRGFEYCRWLPLDQSIMIQGCLGHSCDMVVAISTKQQQHLIDTSSSIERDKVETEKKIPLFSINPFQFSRFGQNFDWAW